MKLTYVLSGIFLLAASCKTLDSQTNSTIISGLTNNNDYLFYYSDPDSSNQVCVTKCTNSDPSIEASQLIEKCARSSTMQTTHVMDKKLFDEDLFLNHASGSAKKETLQYVFGQISDNLDAVSTARLNTTSPDVKESILELYNYSVKNSKGTQCDLAKAFSVGKPSILYAKSSLQLQNGFYFGKSLESGYFYENKPHENWSNQFYRAPSKELAKALCEAQHGSGECTFPSYSRFNQVTGRTKMGYSSGRVCLAGDTIVLGENGEERRIDEIQVGDVVQGFNPATREIELTEVLSVFARSSETTWDVQLPSGQRITATPSHRFYHPPSQTGVSLRQLVEKDHGLTAANENGSMLQVSIQNVRKNADKTKVYNLFTTNKTFLLKGGIVSVSYEDNLVGPDGSLRLPL